MTYLIPHIAVLNASDSTCTDGEIDAMIMAIQHQVTYQFRPWWGVNASIQRYADESAIPTAANVRRTAPRGPQPLFDVDIPILFENSWMIGIVVVPGSALGCAKVVSR